MSHNIEMVNGQASIAWAGDVPWHGLGVKVLDDLTPQQMLEAAGLDWSVESKPLIVEGMETGHNALIRDNKGERSVLDVISTNWEPCQNQEAFEFFNDFIAAGDMKMHTAGSLNGGKMVWALAKVEESFEILGGDKVESYLLFSNPHQYGKSIDIRFTPVRVVCNNTLTLSLSNKDKQMVKVSHRNKFDGDSVKESLGIAKDKLLKYKEMALYLSSKQYDKESIVEYFNRVFGTKGSDNVSRNAKIAMDIIEQQPGHEYAPGSWWNAFNNVTFMLDHVVGGSNEKRMSNSWYGWGADKKIDAMELALKMAAA